MNQFVEIMETSAFSWRTCGIAGLDSNFECGLERPGIPIVNAKSWPKMWPPSRFYQLVIGSATTELFSIAWADFGISNPN